jgi:DNA-directed RNA polymerase subunit K
MTQEYTKYEKAHLIGTRALQLAQGAPLKIKVTDKELASVRYNPIELAKMEFEAGVIPLRIIRPVGVSFSE